jgi:hypothetical protein
MTVDVSRQTANAALLQSGVTVSRQTANAALLQTGVTVSRQTANAALLQTGVTASRQTVYAALLVPPPAPAGHFGIRQGAKKVINVQRGGTAIGRVYRGAQLIHRKGAAVGSVLSDRWRIRYASMHGGGNAQVRDIRMRQTANGPDLCVGGTPFSSSSFSSSFAASMGFDHQGPGNSSSKWSSNAFQNQESIGYQFLQPVEVNFIEMWCGNSPADMIREGVLEYWNGTDWVFRRYISQPAWAIDEMRQIDVSAFTPPAPGSPSSTRFRIQLASSNSGFLGFGNIEMRATAGGADLIGPGIPRSSTAFAADFRAHMAVDRRNDTLYHSANSNNSDWWEYEWPYPVTVRELVIRARASENGVAPRDFTFQRWNGSSLVTQRTITGLAAWASEEVRALDVS